LKERRGGVAYVRGGGLHSPRVVLVSRVNGGGQRLRSSMSDLCRCAGVSPTFERWGLVVVFEGEAKRGTVRRRSAFEGAVSGALFGGCRRSIPVWVVRSPVLVVAGEGALTFAGGGGSGETRGVDIRRRLPLRRCWQTDGQHQTTPPYNSSSPPPLASQQKNTGAESEWNGLFAGQASQIAPKHPNDWHRRFKYTRSAAEGQK
jgi:hypothetical protein